MRYRVHATGISRPYSWGLRWNRIAYYTTYAACILGWTIWVGVQTASALGWAVCAIVAVGAAICYVSSIRYAVGDLGLVAVQLGDGGPLYVQDATGEFEVPLDEIAAVEEVLYTRHEVVVKLRKGWNDRADLRFLAGGRPPSPGTRAGVIELLRNAVREARAGANRPVLETSLGGPE